MDKYIRKVNKISIVVIITLLFQSITAFAQDNYYPNMSSTPNNASVNTIWNTMSKSGVDAYFSKLHTPSKSSYLNSTTIDNKTENYYLMEINVHSSWEYGKRYTIYTDTSSTSYKYVPYYSNGYYTTWYPDKFSFKNGIFVIPNLYYKKYSWSYYYYYFKLYDLFYNRDYSLEYLDLNADKPYFCSDKLTNNTRIVYGRANWFNDKSGDNTLVSIDRKSGTKVQNSNIYYRYNSEFENGVLMNENTYAFVSSIRSQVSGRYVSGYTLFIIDPDTLTIKSKVPLSGNYNLSLDTNGNLMLKNGSSSLIVDGTNFNVIDQAQDIQNATNAVQQLESALSDLSTQDLIDSAQSNLNTAQTLVDKLPDGIVKNSLQDRINAAQVTINAAEATLAVQNLENALADLSTQYLVDDAQSSLNTAQLLVDKLPDGDIKNSLQDRINTAQLTINVAQATIKIEVAENTITQDAVDDAQNAIGILPAGDAKTALEERVATVKAVVDAIDQVDLTQTNLTNMEETLLTIDLSTNSKPKKEELINSLQTQLDEVTADYNEAESLINAIPSTDNQTLLDRIAELKEQIASINGYKNSISEILDEAQSNANKGNGNADIKNNITIDFTINVVDAYGDQIEESIGLDGLKFIAIDQSILSVDDDGNVTATRNGVAKMTVYNDNGIVNIYFIVENNGK